MQKFSYHTHTKFSDAENTLEEMLSQAVNLGWEEIGISDHMVIHKDIKNTFFYEKVCRENRPHMAHDDFNEAKEFFARNADYIRKVSKNYPLKVRIGFEVDYFTYDGWEDEFKDFINQIDHDYLLSGNHFFLNNKGDFVGDVSDYKNKEDSDKLGNLDEYIHIHFNNIKKAVKSGLFNFLAHLDYIRKVKVYESEKFTDDCLQIVKALKETGMGCELSTKGLRKIGDYYPQNNILRELVKEKVPLVISDDAHKTTELGYAFDKAEDVLKEVGCQCRFRLK